MKKVIFEGSGVAIVTPFDGNGKVNYPVLENLINFQIDNGTDCIISVGTTGEGATLSTEEHLEVAKFTIEKTAGRVPVVVSTGSNDTLYAAELSQEAEKIGADGLLLVTPYYNKTSQKGLIESYTYVADRVNIPCILYNVPSRTGLNIQPKTYFELSKHPNIVATKEASGNIAATMETMNLCGDDLAIYSGEDFLTYSLMTLGAKGVISVFANALPRELHDICHAVLDGDYEKARKLNLKYYELMQGFFMDVNPIPIKEAMNMMGMNVGRCRLPLTDMTEENHAMLEAMMKRYGVI
ncbi:MAG: 4-hydroxy-tetrahydrodipicolinate synthase [Clostridia bacterium]|nr:4-hydroxy-tetrahydrodipicolinate synthase [Clostridia bacterium]